MKLFAPINSLTDAEELTRLGADELYCGVIPEEWMGEYRSVKPPNRRANEHSQVGSLAELREISEVCSEHNVNLYITLNAHFYSEDQATLLRDLVREISPWDGVAGYIVADVHFMREIADDVGDCDLLASTGATVFNGGTASFLHEMGADGVHLPRHLTIEEIGAISRTAPPEFDLYAFVLNRNCMMIDGNCTLLHNPPIEHEDAERIPCFQTFARRSVDGEVDPDESRLFDDPCRSKSVACGICSLYQFDRIGLSGVKMVGRGLPLEQKRNQVELLDRVRGKLDAASSEEEFKELVKPLARECGMECSLDACYYPTVMTP